METQRCTTKHLKWHFEHGIYPIKLYFSMKKGIKLLEVRLLGPPPPPLHCVPDFASEYPLAVLMVLIYEGNQGHACLPDGRRVVIFRFRELVGCQKSR